MNKNEYRTVKLTKGEVAVYDFGSVKLHAYRTDDPMSDEVFVFEKNGKFTVLESPCFYDNESALGEYLSGKEVAGMLIAYHAAGGKFLPGVKKYATAGAKAYGENGGGKALIDGFTAAFGSAFDNTVHKIDEIIEGDKVEIGGIEFDIHPNAEAYTVYIPEIDAVYTHMLGHDCHSIVAGAGHADAIIAELNGYVADGVNFILTSHYTPEDLKDARTKIAYLQDLKNIAARVRGAEEFKAEVRKNYPSYCGENYLEMTAGMFFKS